MARVGPWILAEGRRQYLEKALQETPPDQNAYQVAYQQLLGLYLQLGYALEPQLLLRQRDAQRRLGPLAFGYQALTVEAGVGHYDSAGKHALSVDQLMKQAALEEVLSGFDQQAFRGDSFQGLQDMLGFDQPGQSHGLQWISQRVGLWTQMGLLALEAGETNRAAECFKRACEDFDRESAFRPLAVRYYRLTTGKDPDEARKR